MNKSTIHEIDNRIAITYTKEEAAMLFDLLQDQMNQLMSLNTKNRLSKEPILNEEQVAYLHKIMEFCAREIKTLWKYV